MRNLAEIRHRENVAPLATQYRTQAQMVMQPITPELLSAGQRQKRETDTQNSSTPQTTLKAENLKQKLKGKLSQEEPAQAPAPPASLGSELEPATRKLSSMFKRNKKTNSSADEYATGKSTTTDDAAAAGVVTGGTGTEGVDADTEGCRNAVAGPSSTAENGTSGQLRAEPTEDSQKPDEAPTTKKDKRFFSGLLKDPRKSKDKDSANDVQAAAPSMGTRSAEATKVAEATKRGDIPQIKVGEGPLSKEVKEEALKRYEDMLESGGGDPLTMLMSADNYGALDAIKELPPARTRSIAGDTMLIGRSGSQLEHYLSADVLASTGRATPAHALSHDRVINAQPSKRGAHRLSVDAMIPVRAVAPGHYLDADPSMSGPQQLFSHELLDDTRVLRSEFPQPYDPDLGKRLATSQEQFQAHDLRSDAALAAPQARPAHDLHSDLLVKSAGSARGEDDPVFDVLSLSPLGAVQDPHSLGDDEFIKENAASQKSPPPDAMMPGEWAPSSSSAGGASDAISPMASLNASLLTAAQALNELHQAMGAASPGKESTTGMSY